MTNQGFIGALIQYWNIDEKPRLNRRNTYFDDEVLSNSDALRVGIVASGIATAIVLFWQLGGVFLRILSF